MNDPRPKSRWTRKAAISVSLSLLILVTLAAALLFDVIDFGLQRPDFYDTERAALVETKWQLSLAIPHGDSTIETVDAHRYIQLAKVSLEKAREEHPEHHDRINQLESMLEELDRAERAARERVQVRNKLYQNVVKEIDWLLDNK